MNTDECIRRRAYELWEQEGKPEDRADAHWTQAAAEIAAEDGSMPHPPAGADVPGPDSGLRTPPSAIERSLQEAAEALRSTDDGQEKPDERATRRPRGRRRTTAETG